MDHSTIHVLDYPLMIEYASHHLKTALDLHLNKSFMYVEGARGYVLRGRVVQINGKQTHWPRPKVRGWRSSVFGDCGLLILFVVTAWHRPAAVLRS